MAKYEITHSCGHTETVQLYGPTKDREYRIARMEKQPCAECRAEEAKAFDEAHGLAELKGSPKQIAWASDIRAEMLSALDGTIERMDAQVQEAIESGRAAEIAEKYGKTVEEAVAEVGEGINKYRAARIAVAAKDSSRWFIDNRGAGSELLVKIA